MFIADNGLDNSSLNGSKMNGDINSNTNTNGDHTYNVVSLSNRTCLPQPPENALKRSFTAVDNSANEEIDIVLNNVVCNFAVRCHLNLRQIALNGYNVEYRRENGMVSLKLRKPLVTASIWSSGKITCTGATSEDEARTGARKVARMLQRLGFNVRFSNYRVINVLGTCTMPFGIKITLFSTKHREAEYEPELHPGVTFKNKELKATLKIYSTGSITVTAPSILNVQRAIEFIFPLVYEFRKERTPQERADMLNAKRKKMEARNQTYEQMEVVHEVEIDVDTGLETVPSGDETKHEFDKDAATST